VLEGHKGAVRSVVELTCGRLASASADKTLRVWCASSGECLVELVGHSGGVMAACALLGGRLASASGDQSVRIWSGQGECVRVLDGHTAGVLGVAALPGGRLASASLDRTVRIWRIEDGECLAVLQGYQGDATALTSATVGL